MQQLQQKIHYYFNDTALLKQALTHKSANKNNNERLEFLGDSILGASIARQLYHKFPKTNEGVLTRIRSQLVRGQTLCELGNELDISPKLILGKGMLKTGGASQCSVLEDVMEAIFGAIWLDSDYQTCEQVILKLYQSRLKKLSKEAIKDPKTQLQEYLQANKQGLPVYELTKTTGKDHCAVFTVTTTLVEAKIQISQQANSIKNAQQACAKFLLDKLQND